MSLWNCPTHGLVGPMACCADASWASVGDPSTEPVATLTTTPDPEWDAAMRDYNADLQRRIVRAYLSDCGESEPTFSLSLQLWPGVPSLRVTDLNLTKGRHPMNLMSEAAKLRALATDVENADVGGEDHARAFLEGIKGRLLDIGLDLDAAVADHFQPSEHP